MTTPLDNALNRLKELKAEIARVERFIEDYRMFSGESVVVSNSGAATDGSGGKNGDGLGNLPVDNFRRGRRTGRTPPSEIARLMERIIRDVGRPMTRGELVESLERREIEIPAEDKKRYIGTIAWRHKGAFVNVEGRGYWLQGEPLIEGLIHPAQPDGEPQDDLPLA